MSTALTDGRRTFFDWSTNSLNTRPSSQVEDCSACSRIDGSRPILNDTNDMFETSFPFGTKRITSQGEGRSRQRPTIFCTSSEEMSGWNPDRYNQNFGGVGAGTIEPIDKSLRSIVLVPRSLDKAAVSYCSTRGRFAPGLGQVRRDGVSSCFGL